MKKLVLLTIIAVLFTLPAFAETVDVDYFDRDDHKSHSHSTVRTTQVTVHDPVVIPEVKEQHNVAGAKIDAPNLVRFTKNLTLGVEGGKDIVNNMFYDSWNWVEADRGYFTYAKVTYTGTLFDFSKK